MDKHDTLLIAGGTVENRKMLRSILSENYNLLEAVNSRQAIVLLEQNYSCIAAVLLDITNPEAINREVLTSPQAHALLSQVPIIVMIEDDTPEVLTKAFSFGASDAIPLNYDPQAMLHRIENIADLHVHKQNLEQMVEEQAAILRHSNDTMVDALSSIIEYRSVESGQHILRIRRFTKILLEEVNRSCPEYELTDEIISIISSAAALHDIGKIAIPDSILMKPGKLTDEERELMKTHAATGCQILESLQDMGNDQYLRYAHNICRYHHERWDGSGYPDGLEGDNIPICAQVVGLADVYDALTTKRVYKDAYSFDSAINMILNGECGVFSPKLLECFKHVTKTFEELARSYADGFSPKTEEFDISLPPTTDQDSSVDRTRAKYYALVHYINGFLIELDLDQGLFHLIYNPYTEFINFTNINSLSDISRLVLEQVVVPEEREQMARFIREDIENFMNAGMRRSSHHFHFRSKQYPEGETFEVTMLRINPANRSRRTLAILCRKKEGAVAAPAKTGTSLPVEFTYTCRYDDDFTLLQLGAETGTLAGYTQQELEEGFGNRLMELVLPEDREQLMADLRAQLTTGIRATAQYRVRHKDGSILKVMNRSRLVSGSDGQEYFYSFLTDISSSMHTYEALNDQLHRYEIILAQTEHVLFELDLAADTLEFSDTWEKIFGFAPMRKNIREALSSGSHFHPDDIPQLFDRFNALLNGSSYEMAESRIATAKGRYLWCRFRASAIRDEQGRLTKIVGIILNIEAEKQAQRVMQDRADRDSLTKLLNNEACRRQAQDYLSRFSQGVSCALLIIDLDNFKQVNDRYGHLFGDTVLATVARELKKMFRSQDIVARIGGDEFLVLMQGIADRELVESRCSRLIVNLRNTFQNHLYHLPLSCSIGIALSPQHGTSYEKLFQKADQALYRAKDAGKDRFVIYDPAELDSAARKKAVTAINNRIDSNEQPSMANGSIVQHAFQRLYTSTDVDASINDILAMMGQQMNVSRVYIFENNNANTHCSNTYEWCNTGIQPQIHNLQNICYETDVPGYLDNYNEQGIFYCPDINLLPQSVYDVVAPQGIKSMLHCAIRDNGVFRGYIGFDECVTQRVWTQEQIDMLSYFSEMLSVFLLKKRAHEDLENRVNELNIILDNQSDWIYVVETRSKKLLYLNAQTRKLAPGANPGMLCYQAIFGRTEPCPNCPCLQNSKVKIRDKYTPATLIAESSHIRWEGQEACMVVCRRQDEITD